MLDNHQRDIQKNSRESSSSAQYNDHGEDVMRRIRTGKPVRGREIDDLIEDINRSKGKAPNR